jgi:phosphoglycolate phosphatase-like HAD superfamily hydrolase
MRALFEVVTLPVSDPDRSLRFYRDQAGFDLDVDYTPVPEFRVIQLTPEGASTSIQFGVGLTDAPAGSVRGLYLVVPDIAACRRDLMDRGVDVGEIRHKQVMLTMPAHPDVAAGLATLRDNGFRLVTLTNSPPNPAGVSPLENAELGGYFERQFTVDACRTFKPARDVYDYVCRELDVAPAECMRVAAHVWDTIGAQSAGLAGALITRPGNAPLPLDGLPQPTLIADDLRQLARQLIGGAEDPQ